MKMKIQESEIILFKEDEFQELGHKFQYNLNRINIEIVRLQTRKEIQSQHQRRANESTQRRKFG